MVLPDPGLVAHRLLGREPDRMTPLVEWTDGATYRVGVGSDEFVVKIDPDNFTIAREVIGQRRALAAGIPAPEIVAADAEALAMRWVGGVPVGASGWADAARVLRAIHTQPTVERIGDGFGGTDAHAWDTWTDFFTEFADNQLRDAEVDLGFDRVQAERIRRVVEDSHSLLDAEPIGWCHGDCQPDHILIDPETERVAAVIDWADHGTGAIAWDLAVLTLDHPGALGALPETVPLYQVVRRVGAAHWYALHGLDPKPWLDAAMNWRPGTSSRI